MQNQAQAIDSKQAASIGLKTAINILDRWNCSTKDAQSILRISQSTFHRVKEQGSEVKLDEDQITRISLILNIHSALRILFENPENCYGFMAMVNNNHFFEGQSPLEIIRSGDFIALYETFRHIDALRGAQW